MVPPESYFACEGRPSLFTCWNLHLYLTLHTRCRQLFLQDAQSAPLPRRLSCTLFIAHFLIPPPSQSREEGSI